MGLPDECVPAWRQRWRKEAMDDAVAAAAARRLAERLASILRDQHGATRVVLMGSLARGEFRRGSDIDLAVSGLPPERFFRIGAEVGDLAGRVHVDIFPVESATPALLASLQRDGVVLEDTARD